MEMLLLNKYIKHLEFIYKTYEPISTNKKFKHTDLD